MVSTQRCCHVVVIDQGTTGNGLRAKEFKGSTKAIITNNKSISFLKNFAFTNSLEKITSVTAVLCHDSDKIKIN